MTSPYLIGDIQGEEGCRLEAYPDPLSGGEPWTVGWGCTGPDIKPGTEWTQQQADDELAKRVGGLITTLRANLAWFTSLDDIRQDVLVQMAYQMGVAGLLAFQRTLAAIEAGHYVTASVDMLQSDWARQTPGRAKRLAQQMRSGLRQP